MERLTERGSEYVKIKGNTTIFSDTERYRAYLNNAIIRLAAYEDIGLTPEEIMERITQPPNDPLTLEELREMDGEAVWCGPYGWKVCYGVSDFRGYPCLELGGGEAISLVGYGDSWKAYRRKPEEGTT